MSDEIERAEKTALDLLARREHARSELTRKLGQRGYTDDVADQVVAGLAERGLLSEQRFAESFVCARVRRGQGPLRLRAELAQRGVEDPIISAALSAPDLDWNSLADEVRRKKFGSAGPADLRERARQTRFLEYRGFTADHIRAAFAMADSSA